MAAFIIRRLLGAIPLLLGVATLIFFVLALAPGDPTAAFAGPSPNSLSKAKRGLCSGASGWLCERQAMLYS
jgi:peptide/nickel transport system permease protein